MVQRTMTRQSKQWYRSQYGRSCCQPVEANCSSSVEQDNLWRLPIRVEVYLHRLRTLNSCYGNDISGVELHAIVAHCRDYTFADVQVVVYRRIVLCQYRKYDWWNCTSPRSRNSGMTQVRCGAKSIELLNVANGNSLLREEAGKQPAVPGEI